MCSNTVCCRGAQACVLAFSCVDRESFKCVAKWKKKVEEECGNIPMVLVMTKMDLLYRAEVDSFEVEKMSRNLGIRLIKTSVKENINVHKVRMSCGSAAALAGQSRLGSSLQILVVEEIRASGVAGFNLKCAECC